MDRATKTPISIRPSSPAAGILTFLFALACGCGSPLFDPPASVEELSLLVEGRDDDGAELHLREHCPDATEATKAVAALDGTIARINRGVGRALTRGLLASAKPTLDGSDARLDVSANPEQVEALVGLALAMLRGP